MDDHEYIIGLLHYSDYPDLVTLYELEQHIQKSIKENERLDEYPFLRDSPGLYNKLYHKWLSMRDYADKRKHTDLTRFDYCPVCGKKINWADIRRTCNG